jgi:hypothetical protein
MVAEAEDTASINSVVIFFEKTSLYIPGEVNSVAAETVNPRDCHKSKVWKFAIDMRDANMHGAASCGRLWHR